MSSMKSRVTQEMGDIVEYLTDTQSLIKQYGTLGAAPSTLDIKNILSTQFDSEDYPFNEANFQSDAFQIDTLTDILEYFKDSFVENMKDKIIAFKDKFLNLIPNLKKNFLANLEDL